LLAIRLPLEIEKRLEELARRTGRSKESFARQVILDHLDDLEDLSLAEQRWEALRKGESEPLSLAEVERRLGLVD
jgi:RHH-type transcriptional regulator, rel operon repressor / antitoxin RelB